MSILEKEWLNKENTSSKVFYLMDYLEREKFLRISISQTQLEQIDEGVKAVFEEIKKESKIH